LGAKSARRAQRPQLAHLFIEDVPSNVEQIVDVRAPQTVLKTAGCGSINVHQRPPEIDR
jgi:hypothetical protein